MSDEDDMGLVNKTAEMLAVPLGERITAAKQALAVIDDEKRGRVCGANLRGKPGLTCKKPPMDGRTRCRLHGGASLAGVDSPNFRTGTLSKLLPARILSSYLENLNDPDLLSLSEDAALIKTRMGDILSQLNVTATTWQGLKDDVANLRAALGSDDPTLVKSAVNILDQHVSEGCVDVAKWRDLESLIKTRRMVVDTDRKLQYEESRTVQGEQLLMMMKATIAIITRHVTDEEIRFRIIDDFRRLTG